MGKWCNICGDDEGEMFIREGRTVCNFHRSMCDGGYTIAEIEAEEREMEEAGELEAKLGYLSGRGSFEPASDIPAQPVASADAAVGAGDASAAWHLAYEGMCSINGDTDPRYIEWRDNHAFDDMVSMWKENAALHAQIAAQANGMTAHELYVQADARAAALEAENAKLRAALEVAERKLNAVIYARPSIVELRREFTALTGIVVPMGGNTIGTEEGRMLRVLMRELLYTSEIQCVDHGWNKRYGKDGAWSEWLPILFDEQLEGEYRVAIAAIKANRKGGA